MLNSRMVNAKSDRLNPRASPASLTLRFHKLLNVASSDTIMRSSKGKPSKRVLAKETSQAQSRVIKAGMEHK